MILALRPHTLAQHGRRVDAGRIPRAPTPKHHPDARDGTRTHWRRRRDLARWAARHVEPRC